MICRLTMPRERILVSCARRAARRRVPGSDGQSVVAGGDAGPDRLGEQRAERPREDRRRRERVETGGEASAAVDDDDRREDRHLVGGGRRTGRVHGHRDRPRGGDVHGPRRVASMTVATPRRATPPRVPTRASRSAAGPQTGHASLRKARTTTWPRSVRTPVRGATTRWAGSAVTTVNAPAGRGVATPVRLPSSRPRRRPPARTPAPPATSVPSCHPPTRCGAVRRPHGTSPAAGRHPPTRFCDVSRCRPGRCRWRGRRRRRR